MFAVGEALQNDMQINLELAAMADELSERYEELNLIFRMDDHSVELMQGHEMLKSLVESCVTFLDVSAVSLLLPDKDVEIIHFNSRHSFPYPATLVRFLKNEISSAIFTNNESVVINSLSDFQSAGAYMDIFKSYRVMAVPVEVGEQECIGVLSVVSPMNHRDFSNSDRNVLENVARKISSVVLVSFDKLTGLANRSLLEAEVDRLLEISQQHGIDHAVIDCDIDKFQIVNDICGNKVGDDLLRSFAKTIRQSCGEGCIVARKSADQFCVVMEDTTLSKAYELARFLRSQVNALEFVQDGHTFDISMCLGVASITARSESASMVLSSAEVACKAAKERGRNQIQLFVPDDSDLLRRRGEMQWVGKIQQALRDDQFVVYAQEIRSINRNSRSIHYEILLRLNGEDGRIVNPGEFIPAAEHFNLMPNIDRWVISHTFEMIRQQWAKMPETPYVFSLNLSGQSMTDEGFSDFLTEQIERTELPNHWICFEITESAAIANLSHAKSIISSIKKMGCRISLDDFGSGLSSYAYLREFDVDCLKIDGSFIRKVVSDDVSRTMVSAMNQIGHSMGLTTVGEWVENGEILDSLREIDVDFAQGFHVNHPQPLDEVLKNALS